MPVPKDKQGGELELYRWREIVDHSDPIKQLYGQREVNPKSVEAIGIRVAYEPNTAIFFLNGPDSLHGVTPRLVGPNVRRYINFLVEGNEPWFEEPPHAENQTQQVNFCRKTHQR